MNSPDLAPLQQTGMEKAATAWQDIEAVEPPFDPINVFKATSSIKCAELLSKLRGDNGSFSELVDIVSNFIEGTMKDFGDPQSGSLDEGMEIVRHLERLFPFNEEAITSPQAFAIRMHTYDGILLLAASKLGKEAEVKERLDQLQMDIALLVLHDVIRRVQGTA